MEQLNALLQGFAVVLTPFNLLLIISSIAIGFLGIYSLVSTLGIFKIG